MKCIIVIVIYGFEALKVSFQTGKNFRWSNTCNICMIRKHSKKNGLSTRANKCYRRLQQHGTCELCGQQKENCFHSMKISCVLMLLLYNKHDIVLGST